MKLKLLVISIFLIPIVGMLAVLFIRYGQIRSVSNYAECGMSPGNFTVVVGTPVCTTLDGRQFESIPKSTNFPITVDLNSTPQVPPIFKNKYTFYAYTIYHSPFVLYKQLKQVAYQFADFLLGIYYK